MLIAELMENCPNDAERLITLNNLKKQIEDQEKAIKEKLIATKIKHSRIQYVERKDWVPSQAYKEVINVFEFKKKEAIEISKSDPNGGSYKISTYIKVVEPKAQKETQPEPSKGPDMGSFFLGNPNNL